MSQKKCHPDQVHRADTATNMDVFRVAMRTVRKEGSFAPAMPQFSDSLMGRDALV